MPVGGAYNPPVLNANPLLPAGAGDQCLRCHNNVTQYNGPRVRDTEETMFMGHKNMSRKVTVADALGRPAVRLHRLPGRDHRRGLHPGRRRLGSDDLSRHRHRSELRLGERHGRHRPGRLAESARSLLDLRRLALRLSARRLSRRSEHLDDSRQAERLLLLRPLPHHGLDGGRHAADRQGAREVVPRHHLGRRHGRGRGSGEPRPRRALHREDGLLGRLRHLLRPLPQLGGRQVGRRL